MKSKIKSVAIPAAFSGVMIFSQLTTPCQESPFYLKGDLGGSLTSETDAIGIVKDPFFGGRVFDRFKARFDPGERVGITVGYRLSDWFAVESDLGATINGLRHPHFVDGTFANVPLLFNVKLPYPNRSHWTPFIGAGLGLSAAILDADVLIRSETFNAYFRAPTTEADVVLAYQAFAGVRYWLNERLGLSVEYRYLAAEGPEWNSATISFGKVETHSFSLAFDYHF